MPPRDWLRPLLGAGTAAILFYAFAWVLGSPIHFFGGEMVALTITPLIAAVLSGAFSMAIFDAGTLGELGLHWHSGAPRNLLLGIAAGALGGALAILPAVWLGLAHFENMPDADVSLPGALFTPILLFCGAAGEEIAFRGFPLQVLIRGYGPWTGVFGIGILFGLVHLSNPNATALAALNTAGFGILFGAALLRTHDLWLPIGLHFGWNLTLPFLGVELSGITIKVAGYRLIWNAGDLWSGGKYGPEAGLPATAVLFLLLAVLWFLPVVKARAALLDPPESAPSPAF
jgi:membrane protease YdiL (CAAX protease family)